MRRFLLFTMCSVPLAAVRCVAQEPAAIATVRAAPSFHTAAEGQFQAYEGSLSTHCTAATYDWPAATHRVYGQPQTGADGNLINATWVEIVPGMACGQARRYRALVTIRGGRAGVLALLPGDGYAGPQLQRDAKLPLAGAVGTVLPRSQNCAVDVIDTHLTGAEPARKQPWNDLWTVSICGKRVSVPMQFVPDAVGEGTSIHIESKSITLLP